MLQFMIQRHFDIFQAIVFFLAGGLVTAMGFLFCLKGVISVRCKKEYEQINSGTIAELARLSDDLSRVEYANSVKAGKLERMKAILAQAINFL